LVILKKGLGWSSDDVVGVGRPEITPLEREVLTRIFGSNPYIRVNVPSMKEEAQLWEEAVMARCGNRWGLRKKFGREGRGGSSHAGSLATLEMKIEPEVAEKIHRGGNNEYKRT
jgi:hypothetical protein